MKKKKMIGAIVVVFFALALIWSAMVIIDYNRAEALKPPLFAIGSARDQHGNGYYDCLGYGVQTIAKQFNGREYVLCDTRFRLFGRGGGGRKSIHDNYRHNLGLLGEDRETVINYLKALEFVAPDVSGKQETYTEYIDGNDVKVMSLIFYNGVMAGFEYEYHNLEAAYEFAAFLRRELEMTFGEKATYPGMAQTNKDYFDNVKGVSELKNQYTYYEDWNAVFEGQKQENIEKMLAGRDYSRIELHFALSVLDENKAIVSARYIALP